MLEYLIQVQNFLLLLALVLNLGLSSFIFAKNSKSEINRSFSAMLFWTAVWVVSLLVFLNLKNGDWILFVRRLTPVGASILVGYFLCFAKVFPKSEGTCPWQKRIFILAPGYVFAALSVTTPWMIAGFSIGDPRYLFLGKPSFGFLYFVWALYFISYFVLASYILYSKFKDSEGRQKLQVWYVLFGTVLAGGGGASLSLLLPLFKVPQFFTIGPLAALILAGFTAYTIIKYRLLQIEDFLTRGVYLIIGLSAIIGTMVFMMTGQVAFVPTFILIFVQGVLGFLIYIRNNKSEINLSYSAIVFFFAFWNYYAYQVTHRISSEMVWADKLIFVVASFLVAFFLHFSNVFPRARKGFSSFNRALIFIFPLILSALVPFNLIIKNISIVNNTIFPVFGPAYPFFMVYAIAYVGFGLFNLIRSSLSSTGIEKLQVRYVLFGLFSSSTLILVSNLILPWLGEARLAPFGPFFTLFFVFATSYAILKHRLMSIEIIVQRGFVYGIVTVIIMALYALAVIISETFLRQIMGYSSLIITAAAALLIAVLYQPMIRAFQGGTDRIFFRGRYDYRKTLREISQRIASVIKLEELTQLIVSSFIDMMKISEISFLLSDKEKEHFRSVPISLPRYNKIEIDVDSPIVSWLNSAKDILVRDEIEDEIGRQEALGEVGNIRRQSLEEVRDEMERLGISVWVPIISKEELIGIIALGNKLSGDIFSTEDIGLLSTLGNQTAVALDNARLYDEVVNMKDYNEEILQSMVTGVMTVDTRGKIVTFNSMAERITGRNREEVLAKGCEDIWGRRGTIPNVIANSLKDRCYVNFESSIASPERGLVPVAFTSTVLRDHLGKKIGALLTVRDLSEVKELEEKVRRADKLTALATMSAGMAHEIKNPLSSMKVLSQLLPKKYDDMEFRKKFEEIVPREINRIDRIVESLLSFARATALTFEKANVNELLEENARYFQDQAKAVDVKITTIYADLPEIELDKGQLSQVFSNLMLNAIQAMSEGGELKVVSMPGKRVMDQLQTVSIKISDTGHGMPGETVNKLFDPFFTTKYGGTGLGLTISHNIVDGHRGYIDVESKVGKGTSFIITLPVSQGLL
ncbi:MAG: ATP-binding protein [Candidatus Margulisiibacteriota bacterium]|nr:ATP-binding protein [Candidatus Margulisiibacteriota bacterium]